MTEKELRIKLSDLCNEAYQAGLDSTAVYGCIASITHACQFILDMELVNKIKEGETK